VLCTINQYTKADFEKILFVIKDLLHFKDDKVTNTMLKLIVSAVQTHPSLLILQGSKYLSLLLQCLL
jgi:hypothetical protein